VCCCRPSSSPSAWWPPLAEAAPPPPFAVVAAAAAAAAAADEGEARSESWRKPAPPRWGELTLPIHLPARLRAGDRSVVARSPKRPGGGGAHMPTLLRLERALLLACLLAGSSPPKGLHGCDWERGRVCVSRGGGGDGSCAAVVCRRRLKARGVALLGGLDWGGEEKGDGGVLWRAGATSRFRKSCSRLLPAKTVRGLFPL
jgi:hypothetical protein